MPLASRQRRYTTMGLNPPFALRVILTHHRKGNGIHFTLGTKLSLGTRWDIYRLLRLHLGSAILVKSDIAPSCIPTAFRRDAHQHCPPPFLVILSLTLPSLSCHSNLFLPLFVCPAWGRTELDPLLFCF
ncbi:hypothetical protein JZ751_009262 [Albula glossodonta]|uniref:Uncharacterized protein n=1 Tax=Albula glossodonta TaxID=121402 RepID=A0A8T2N3M9_9TELE|nr:hypothetical protein JZ751_009262 [Albula glossodonta]